MNQVLGAFELLGARFETDDTFISLIFVFFFRAAVNRGY
jgi:hypothetical protein